MKCMFVVLRDYISLHEKFPLNQNLCPPSLNPVGPNSDFSHRCLIKSLGPQPATLEHRPSLGSRGFSFLGMWLFPLAKTKQLPELSAEQDFGVFASE